MMTTNVQKISPFKAATCPPRGAARAVAVRPTAAMKKQSEGAVNWSTLPVAAASAVMLLTSGAANATALGKAYGGSVGGSDQFQETVERGIGKVAPGSDTANSPFNVEDPNKVVDNVTSDTLGGALNQTVSNVKNTFSTGGQNLKEVTNAAGNKLEGAASNVQNSSPDIFKQSAANVGNKAEETKNIFQSGADKIQELVGGGPSQEPFKTGADALQQGGDAAKGALQSGKDALSQGGLKAKQTAGDAQSFFKTGSDKLQEGSQLGKQTASSAQDAFRTGTDNLQGAGEKGKDFFGGIGDALKGGADSAQQGLQRGTGTNSSVPDFRSGTDQLEKAGKKVQGLAEDVQAGAQEAGRKAQQTGKTIFGQ